MVRWWLAATRCPMPDAPLPSSLTAGIVSLTTPLTGSPPMCACRSLMSTTARHRESLPVMSTWLARCLPEVGRPLPLLRHILQAFSLCYVLSTGTELCTVVESMFSFETLFEIQGDPVFGIPTSFLSSSSLSHFPL